MNYAAAFGGANVDTHVKSDKNVRLRDSNPSSVTYSAGGVARNIAENLAALGVKTVFLGAVGDDSNGEGLIKYSEKCGIDASQVLISRTYPTSTYIAFIEPDGEMFAAANDMKITSEVDDKYITSKSSIIKGASCIVADANCSGDAIYTLCRLAAESEVPVIADATSMAKARSLLKSIKLIRMIKCNADELAVLSGLPCDSDGEIKAACKALLDLGLYSVCVTLGARGCCYSDVSGTSFFASLAPLELAADTTGCGDAFCAGAAFALMNGEPPEEMAATALACGRITAQSKSTINEKLCAELVNKEKENGFKAIY